MPLIVSGINHHTAPLSVRERLAFNDHQTKLALQQLQARLGLHEAVLLSTCNRTEIYGAVNPANDPENGIKKINNYQTVIADWFCQQHPGLDLKPFIYQHEGQAGMHHLLRVASGLDSMVLGEPEIFGQVKNAYQLAVTQGAVGTELQRLFPAVFAACKQIRHESGISEHPVSLAYVTVQLAKRIFTDLSQSRVLLVGAGELIELLALHLKKSGIKQIKVANRTLAHAEQLAASIDAQALRLEDIPMQLTQIDVLITAAHSPLPLIGKGMLETVLKSQKRRPIFMADLAVPRNIEPEVGQLADVYLYNIDDLEQVIKDNLKNRTQLAELAEVMVDTQIAHYERQQRIAHASHIISKYREQALQIRDAELQRAQELLQKGQNPQEVLQLLAHQLTNKILHQPTVKLRQAAYHKKMEILQAAIELLYN